MTVPIFRQWNDSFGDALATFNLLIARGLRLGFDSFKLHCLPGQETRLREIAAALECGECIQLTDEPWTTELDGFNVWAAKSVPTKRRWEDGGHKICCYQLDGVTSFMDKNPSPEEATILERWLAQCGFMPIRLGKHLSIAQCVDYAAHSAFFVGVDSGCTHLAHAVGVPVFLLQFKLPVVTCHRGRPYILCDGVEDLLRWKYPTVVDMWRFIGHPDGERATLIRNRAERDKRKDSWWLQ